MSTRAVTIAPADEMGHVLIPLTVRNQYDDHDARHGRLDPGAVRSATVEDALADTGATELALPRTMVEALGLDPIEQTIVMTAAGRVPGTVYAGVLVTVDGRTRPMTCLALPDDVEPLLGAIGMEILGIELDLRERTYRLLPDGYSRL